MAESSSSSSLSSESLTEYLPLEKAKSPVWRFFGFPARDGKFLESNKKKRQSVYCKLCKQVLSYKGNTTNMLVHLQYYHKGEYSDISSKTTVNAGRMSTQLQEGQRSITEAFEQLSPIPRSSSRWKSLTNSVCYCIAKDMLPFDCVNDSGFRHMLHTFEPRYVPPDRSTITRHYMPELYDQEKTKVTEAIATELQYFAFTSDGWSSRANHSYISLTIHYIDSQWAVRCHLLETAEFTTNHTADNLAISLQDLLARWKLPMTCLSGATTDNARNIVLALDNLDWPHIGCFAHTLQLGVQKAMEVPEIARALGRAKRLVSHFHHSVKSTNVLRQKQKDLHHAEQNLIQDVPTRWNSSYYMIERILKQQQPLCAALLEIRKTELMPKHLLCSLIV